VKNFARETTTDSLKEAFIKYGEIKDVYIPIDFRTHEAKGFAFVEFIEDNAAETAVQEMNGATVEGSVLEVMKARERRKTRDEMGGDRYGYVD